MSIDREERGEGFLGRWSRVKREARETEAAPVDKPRQSPSPLQAEDEPPALPAVEELTFDSDYRDFFHPKVGEDVRRGALRKLFSDPHFNVMDGLDVYIDDYTKTEPIPTAMLAGLKQAQRILEWAAETEEEAVIRRSRPPGVQPEAAAAEEGAEGELAVSEAAAPAIAPPQAPADIAAPDPVQIEPEAEPRTKT
jgi:hypothetical protein